MRPVGTLALCLAVAWAIAAQAEPGAPAHLASARVVDAGPERLHARERLREIQRRVQAALRYPPLARAREVTGTTWVRFDIGRDGQPHTLTVHRSSGSPQLDRAAEAAVEAAAPLPWVYGRLELPVAFRLERRK